mmetsp:Transcript_47253/g.110415  ORF Transcript_47253/g.110415 Transcript_47253/m.110415 type:complete len:224 (-) Transcript_47253:520-1191(-)
MRHTVKSHSLQVESENAEQVEKPLQLTWPRERDVADDAHILQHAYGHGKHAGRCKEGRCLGSLLSVEEVVAGRYANHGQHGCHKPSSYAERRAVPAFVRPPRLPGGTMRARHANQTPSALSRITAGTEFRRQALVDIKWRGRIRVVARQKLRTLLAITLQTLLTIQALTSLIAGVALALDTPTLPQFTRTLTCLHVNSTSEIGASPGRTVRAHLQPFLWAIRA